MSASLLLLLAVALADEAGEAWLERVDAANNEGSDAHLILDLKVADSQGKTVERSLEIWQKGDDKRLVKITAPARLAGVALLIPDGETTYVYLPAYGRPKRVVGDQRSDAFLGTDFSIEELSRMAWAPEYDATVAGDEGATVRLSLSPQDPKAHKHTQASMWVRKADDLPSKIEYTAADGTPTRRVTLSGFDDAGGRPLAHHLKVEDLERGTWTEATVRTATFDGGIEDDVFDLANLSR
jgi:hypothetical protein